MKEKSNIPLLSVIVACYNLENYLERCISSILQSQYTNLEVILINDGSTDNTAKICDELKSKENRIKVIHQKNIGLPRTRQVGISNALAEYITFVDGDDTIMPQMYSNMMTAITRQKVDIAQCGAFFLYEDGQVKHQRTKVLNGKYSFFNRVDGVKHIVEDKIWHSYMWNKIYKKSLFKNINFSNERGLDEDTTVMHQIFDKAQNGSIYFMDEYYAYFQRNGSITKQNKISSKTKNIYDRCEARYERFVFIKDNPDYSEVLNIMANIYVSTAVAGLRQAILHREFFPNKYSFLLIERIIDVKKIMSHDLNQYISKLKKVELLLIQYNPNIYILLAKVIVKYFKRLD